MTHPALALSDPSFVRRKRITPGKSLGEKVFRWSSRSKSLNQAHITQRGPEREKEKGRSWLLMSNQSELPLQNKKKTTFQSTKTNARRVVNNYDKDAETGGETKYKKVITFGIVTCNQLDAGYFNSCFLLAMFSSYV